MKDDTLSRAHRITDARAAAALSDPLRRRLVLELAGRERALAELAASCELDLKRVHYHVTALKKLGLVKVTRKQERAGRAIKFYRAVADAFFVPADTQAQPPHAALARELSASIARLRDASLEGTLYHVSDDGRLRMQAVQRALVGGDAHGETWRVLRLSRADAARLAKDVETCFLAFAARDRRNAKAYLVRFAFAPRVPE